MKSRIGNKIVVVPLLILIVQIGLLCLDAPKVSAGTYDDAYNYYTKYGNRIVFVPSTEEDGNIYYATKAKRSSSSILFSNIGWKAIIKDDSDNILQEIYYKMSGNYLKTTDIRTADDGYEYALYSVTLKEFKSRLNSTSLNALRSGKCKVIFNACIIVKKDGIPSGGMTDEGVSWGTVYTTYDGIVNAEEWSTITRNSLSTYYNKEVEGLFHQVTLENDEGIIFMTGAGTYCYGTVVNLYAVPRADYAFSHWNGSASWEEAKFSITITGNQSYKANSIKKNMIITYYRNRDLDDTELARRICVYGEQGQKLTHFGWTKTGYYQTGWKYNREGLGADCSITEEITSDWIRARLPQVSLYGNWIPNRYAIQFDANGAYNYPQIQTRDVNYESIFTLPECEYVNKKANFLGWSLKADDRVPQFKASDEVTIRDVAEQLGIENSDGATITFYAIWDTMPAINASNIYVSLHNAQAGNVTAEYIASYASATDKEDGSLSYGIKEHHVFLLKDYDKDVYLNAKKEGYVKETFVVIDSSGNRVERTIKVYLIDTKIYTEAEIDGTIRFISQDYFNREDGSLLAEDEGGLKEESVWRRDEEFLKMLEGLFSRE